MQNDPVLPSEVELVVYKEILDGDRRKFEASSNDANTGGGARDLRFSPYKKFDPVFRRLFTQKTTETRRRNNNRVSIDIFTGHFSWLDENNQKKSMPSRFEPPTDVRRNEGRIPKVHEYPCFERIPSSDKDSVFLLLILQFDGTVWPIFATKTSLEEDDWNPNVKSNILGGLRAKHRKDQASMGFIDFKNEVNYCNGNMRIQWVPGKKESGMGQIKIWHAEKQGHNDSIKKILKYIEDVQFQKEDESSSMIAYLRKSGSKVNNDRKLLVEKSAINKTTSYFEEHGFVIESVEGDNVGWDLEAKKNGELVFRIEVKGLSGEDVKVELTPNEYSNMKKFVSNYKLCVVSRALSNMPVLRVFSFDKHRNEWNDNTGKKLRFEPIESARIFIE